MRAARREPDEPPLGTLLGRGRTADVVTWGPGRALKLFRPDAAPEAVAAEAAAVTALAATGVPAPRLLDVVEEDGRTGLVFERVEGPSMLAELSSRPWRMRRIARDLAALQVRVQGEPGTGLPSLRARVRERLAAAPLDAEARAHALAVLDGLPDGDRLCHGALHPGNVVLTSRGPFVIDWSDAAAGHPDADAARTRLLLRIAPVPPGAKLQPLLEAARDRFCRAYVAEYLRLRPDADLEAWEGVLAAARLADGIAGEAAALRGLVDRSRRM